MSWHPFDDGESIGQVGSEGGRILRDEAHEEGARITLERDGRVAPFAITCGVYDWMVHTRFFDTETESLREFEAMKVALARLVAGIPWETDRDAESKIPAVSESMSEFVRQFP